MKLDQVIRVISCILSILALLAMAVTVWMYCANALALAPLKHWLLTATVIWFVATLFLHNPVFVFYTPKESNRF